MSRHLELAPSDRNPYFLGLFPALVTLGELFAAAAEKGGGKKAPGISRVNKTIYQTSIRWRNDLTWSLGRGARKQKKQAAGIDFDQFHRCL